MEERLRAGGERRVRWVAFGALVLTGLGALFSGLGTEIWKSWRSAGADDAARLTTSFQPPVVAKSVRAREEGATAPDSASDQPAAPSPVPVGGAASVPAKSCQSKWCVAVQVQPEEFGSIRTAIEQELRARGASIMVPGDERLSVHYTALVTTTMRDGALANTRACSIEVSFRVTDSAGEALDSGTLSAVGPGVDDTDARRRASELLLERSGDRLVAWFAG